MTHFIYRTNVVNLGASALDFLNEKMIIFFNKQAQADIAEFSVLLDDLEGGGEIGPGDILLLGEKEFAVTAVGEVANQNFLSLGHAAIHFDGQVRAVLPGAIHVENLEIPSITTGMPVAFKREV